MTTAASMFAQFHGALLALKDGKGPIKIAGIKFKSYAQLANWIYDRISIELFIEWLFNLIAYNDEKYRIDVKEQIEDELQAMVDEYLATHDNSEDGPEIEVSTSPAP